MISRRLIRINSIFGCSNAVNTLIWPYKSFGGSKLLSLRKMSEFDNENQFSSVVGGLMDCKSYPPEDIFDPPKLMRRQSTLQDEQRIIFLLQDILEDQNKTVSSWIVENKVKILCFNYKNLLDVHKEGFLKVLATKYSVDHDRICKALNQYKDFEPGSTLLLKAEEQLKVVLTPQYSWLFKVVGRLENGVKFLVDWRTDVLMVLSKIPATDPSFVPLQHLNNSLKDLLSLWFSVGFLNLERVTWKSSCEMLQKVSEYEAVHPVRSWADLKRRVGLYRRCYVYTHSSMPSEPIVVLHTALTPEISSSIKAIVTATQRMSSVESNDEGMFGTVQRGTEDPCNIKAAIFYSITSTQKGLQGIELGNYLIKTVVREIQAELPNVHVFSSLSPIPRFKSWLLEKLKSVENGASEPGLDIKSWKGVLDRYNGAWSDLKKAIVSNMWHSDREVSPLFEVPLMKACAYYLYLEKIRSSAYDPVANFHLRNGAVMWRLNWLADTSPRGMNASCGLMVNYRYFLEELEDNSRRYLEENIITADDQILKLVELNARM